MHYHGRLVWLFAVIGAASLAGTARAWDPNSDTDASGVNQAAPHAGSLPSYVVPQRYYTAPYMNVAAPSAPQPVATTAATAGTAPVYAAPVVADSAPAYTPPPAAADGATPSPFITTPPPADAAAPPAAYAYPNHGDTPKNQHYVGVEGFYDEYKEPVAQLDSTTVYGALDAGITHYFDPATFGLFEARASYGDEHYKSESGIIDSIPNGEFEVRAAYGYDYLWGNAMHLKPYAGLGGRYYIDGAKGYMTSSGAGGYDRKIFQLYVPLGVTYEFHAYGLTFDPNAEYDQMLYGHVASRLQTLNGYSETINEQEPDEGYGLRGEFAISKLDDQGRGWQFSPFIRYWHFNNSDTTYALSGYNSAQQQTVSGFVEPQNNRVQAGAKLKYLF